MNLELLKNISAEVIALFIVILVVKYFIKAMTKKDEDIKALTTSHQKKIEELTQNFVNSINGITEKYSTTVNNHIHHDAEAREKEGKILFNLTKVIKDLAGKVEDYGGFAKKLIKSRRKK